MRHWVRLIFVKFLGKADLWSDVPPRIRLWVRLTFLSDLLLRLTFGQTYPPGSGFGSGWHFCQIFGTSCGQLCYYFGQLNLWSDVPPQAETSCGHMWYYFTIWSGRPLVRCTTQWAETSCGQVWYYFRLGWPVYLRVSLVPAAVVIPAPLAYIKVVAVKKLVLSLFV